ncbi:MAG: hypothetical protein MI919_08910 [Holophagales bacterium]|nr:hypothetical protein [Holophagales bacterium]
MDPDLIVMLVVFLFWIVSSILGAIKKMMANRPGQGPPEESDEAGQGPGWQGVPPPPPTQPSSTRGAEEIPDPVRELMRQLGMEPAPQPEEAPVPSEHVLTRSEHRQAPGELSRTPSEHVFSAGEHSQAARELRRSASEHTLTPSEHRGTPGEHLKGDLVGSELVEIPAHLAASGTGRAKRRNPALARAVRRDLFGDSQALGRAWVLKEILGSPRGLTPYGSEEQA